MEFTVRPARPDDHPALLRLFPLLGVDDPLPDLRRWTEQFCPATVVACDASGHIGAYLYAQRLAGNCYVRNLVVEEAWQGRRVGRRLLLGLAAELRAEGITRWELNVKPENTPAVALYRRVGMARMWGSVALRMPWAAVEALPVEALPAESFAAGVDGVTLVQSGVTDIAPEDDARWEAAFHLSGGQIALARDRARRLPLGLEEGGEPAALAVFAPDFPGAFPFHLRRPGLARPLLMGIRPRFDRLVAEEARARGEIHIVVEDDQPLQRFLLAHGAILKLEIDHYRGEVPDPAAIG